MNTIIIAVDLSGSMHGKPLATTQKAVKEFVNELQCHETKIILMPFADGIQIHKYSCGHLKKLYDDIDKWHIGMVGYGNSNQPFTYTYMALKDCPSTKTLIVLTDGIWFSQSYAIQEAQKCKEIGIKIRAIGIGDADKDFLDQVVSSNESALITNLAGLNSSFLKLKPTLSPLIQTPIMPVGKRLSI